MIQFLIENAYIIPVCICMFALLYVMGGEDIIWFRKKHYAIDEKSGENLAKELSKYARFKETKVLGRTTIRYNNIEMTFDAILLSYFGTIAFIAMPQGGELYGETEDETWVQIWEGKRRVFYNPSLGFKGYQRFFREMYKAENVKFGLLDTFVVFTNKDASVAIKSKLTNVTKIDRLSEMLNGKAYTADNGADIDAMEQAINKYKV